MKGLTSKQNKAHIYVGTVMWAITIKSNLPRGEPLSPPSVQSFLLLSENNIVTRLLGKDNGLFLSVSHLVLRFCPIRAVIR